MKLVALIFLIISLLVAGCADQGENPLIINDFEVDADLDAINWKCHTLFTLSSAHVVHGQKSLCMSLFPSPYPGVSFKGLPNKWSAYHHLAMDVYNPQDQGEVAVTLRIDDKKMTSGYNDRVNRRISLKPGMNHLKIVLEDLVTPSGRPLDVGHIYALMMFMGSPLQETTLYVDHVRLENL